MAILRDFEKRLEGAVEGFFARAFRSGLQPVELAKAIQRYAANYQQVGLDGVFVPNVYRFELADDDYQRFSGFDGSLRRELGEVVTRTATERGWKLQGPVRIEVRTADHVRVGTYELRGKAEALEAAPSPSQTPDPGPEPSTVGSPAPRVAAPGGRGPVTIVEDGAASGAAKTTVMRKPAAAAHVILLGAGTRHPLPDQAVLGRLPECDVVLDDASVSRRHARVTRLGGRWTIEDLGSTNGVKVNGELVGATDLTDGDRLELGTVKLAFSTAG